MKYGSLKATCSSSSAICSKGSSSVFPMTFWQSSLAILARGSYVL